MNKITKELNKIAASISKVADTKPLTYELMYRIPGKGGWKRKSFNSENARDRFVDKLLETEGDDVEFSYPDNE